MINKSFGIARRKGRQAAREGKPETANPYGTEATNGKRITFARRFFLEWRAGYRAELRHPSQTGPDTGVILTPH